MCHNHKLRVTCKVDRVCSWKQHSKSWLSQAPAQPADPSMPEDGIKSLAEAAEASYSCVFIRTSFILFLILSRESL